MPRTPGVIVSHARRAATATTTTSGARVRATRALLAGGLGPLGVIAAIVFAQRLSFPLAVLPLGDRPAVTAAALLAAAALGFVRARAADRLARVVRLNLLELYLAPFERGPAPRPCPPPRSSRRASPRPCPCS